MVEGIQAAGALNDARPACALGQVELAHILAEVGLRRFAKAVDGKTADLSEGISLAYMAKICCLSNRCSSDDADDGLARLREYAARA